MVPPIYILKRRRLGSQVGFCHFMERNQNNVAKTKSRI